MRNSLIRFEDTFRNSFKLLDELDKDLGRIFNSLPRNYHSKNGFGSCDVEDKDTHYLVSIDLPGIPKKEINIEVAENNLRIWGERKAERKEADYTERYWGKFERNLPIPAGVDEKQIEAKFENGVLYLTIPKAKEIKSKLIEIK